jgi:hypothetical protein
MIINKNTIFNGKGYTVKPSEPLLGCVYRGDTGNSNWVTGILIQVDGSDSVLRDARGKKHVVLTMMLRSVQ